MKHLIYIFLWALVAACASSRSSQLPAEDYSKTDPAREARIRAAVAPNNPVPATRAPANQRVVNTSTPVAKPTLPATTDAPDWMVTSIKSKFLAEDTTGARIYMDMTVRHSPGQLANQAPKVTDLTEHFILNYVLYPDYNNRERLGYGNVPLLPQNVLHGPTDDAGDHFIVFFDVKRPINTANALLLAEITETSSGQKALNDLTVRFTSSLLRDRFALFTPNGERPLLRNFVTVTDTVLIRDVAGTSKPLQVVRYRHTFDPASSPMNLTAKPAPKALQIDSTLTVMTNQPFKLPAEGLYFFQDDTTQANGMSLLVTDDRYPRLTYPAELVKPVLYMSTSQEINELNGASDFKKALDRYWLSLMAGNEDVARQAIRAYYKHVETANRLFTTYKEGWKTDKGMIYIIMGPPDRVQRSRDREVWVYTRRATTSELNFTFNKKPNQFVDDHYELVRYAEFQPIWYPIVESWRNGSIRE